MPLKLLAALFLFFSMTIQAQIAATAEDLSWLTGTWQGTIPEMAMDLEEIWNEPNYQGIQALVRLSISGNLFMLEMISIEESDGSLRLHIQQWNPGIEPREQRQVMNLESISEQEVKFVAAEEGILQGLTYKRTEDTLEITVIPTAADPAVVNLQLAKP
ncbi:MAG: DUF6265 family protein [Gammaproteobacteria bacterium]|nr:DUF6265 family protein [Gammaproteobacteria bacterium]